MTTTKTLAWTKFIKLVATTPEVRIEGVPMAVSLTLVRPDERLRIEWSETDGTRYCYYVANEQNRKIPVNGHTARLVGYPEEDNYNQQAEFVFQFFNLQPREI